MCVVKANERGGVVLFAILLVLLVLASPNYCCAFVPPHRAASVVRGDSLAENHSRSRLFTMVTSDDVIHNVPNVYNKPHRLQASFQEQFNQKLHIWLVRHPNNLFSRLLLPPLSLFEGVKANDPTYLGKKRDMWGPNFCVAGEVVLGEFSAVSKALVEPQGRTFRLGTSILDAKTLPMGQGKGRNVFLLALPDQGADGTGEHEAFRKAITDHVISQAAMDRTSDATCQKLLDQVAKDYAEMDHGRDGSFFQQNDRGLNAFFIRYMHYVLFELDPNNDEQMELLTELYYGSRVTVYWFRTFGNILRKLNIFGGRKWPDMIDKVVEIYKESPALANFQEANPEYMHMTKHELASACIPLLGIAALIGPQHLAQSSMGALPLPAYDGHEHVAEVDVTKVWDDENLQDREALEKYLFECGRLWNPVSSTHHVAQEEFTTTIGDDTLKFPKGTIVNIPIILSSLDEGFWGPTTYEFNHKRENLCPYSMIFNSVGDASAGRICPGRELTLKMLTDVLQVTGKVRREETQK